MNKKKRILSILLCVAMLVTMIPGTALAADTYTVTFKDGGGSGTMDPVTVEAGEYTLPECTFSYEGHEFKAWAYNSNVGEQLQPGTKINIRDNIRLYAVWQKKIYTITAISEDESKGTVSGGGTYEYSDRASLTATPKEGYVFEGWYKDGERVTGSLANGSFYVSGDATYTAKFTKADDIITAANAVIEAPIAGAYPDMTPEASNPDKYTVTFYKWYDSSYNEMGAGDTFEGGKEYELRVVFEAKEGYKFDGTVVFTVNGEATEDFTDANPYSVTRRKIKFQVPAAASYPVTIENGKINISGGTSSGNYGPGSIVAIIANAPESGKRFKEWTATDGVSFADATAAATSFTMPAKPVTITATYEDIPAPTTYTVSFDANGGTGTMAAVSDVSGEYQLPANGFTAPSGKQFKCWSVDGAEKAVGDKITVTADTTVKAVWKDTSAGGGGGGYFAPTVQKPVIETGEGVNVTLSADGKTASIEALEGYEVDSVVLNGVEKGAVNEVKGLKTGDKLIVSAKKIAPDYTDIIEGLKDYELEARSKLVTMKNGKKAVKITWYDENGLELNFDGVEIFRSIKRYSGYGKKPIFTTEKDAYYNTLIEKGTKYFYKVRGYVELDGERYYTEWSSKAWRTVK